MTLEAAAKIPSVAAVLATMSPETLEAQQARDVARQRQVLVDGEWDEYLADLKVQGAAYAQMGIEFRDWYALLGSYRKVIRRKALPHIDARAEGVLVGMDRFTDIGMAELGTAYLTMKEDLVRKAEAEVDRFVDLFQSASLGMVIWQLEDPSDLGRSGW
ncbi:MAG: hypothetical protein IPN17_28785 [Deltaproteobacteria bacterium]|nr:hypothetical protein [Deltaproteobacteria bacterium]